jgi:hypothetical protein
LRLDDKIADMKDRLTRIEGMDLGSNLHREQQLGQSADTQGRNTIAIVAAALAALAIALNFMHSPSAPSFSTTPANVAPAICAGVFALTKIQL